MADSPIGATASWDLGTYLWSMESGAGCQPRRHGEVGLLRLLASQLASILDQTAIQSSIVHMFSCQITDSDGEERTTTTTPVKMFLNSVQSFYFYLYFLSFIFMFTYF